MFNRTPLCSLSPPFKVLYPWPPVTQAQTLLHSPWPLRGLRQQSLGTRGSTPPLPAIPIIRHRALLSPGANSLQLLQCRREQAGMVGREAVPAACFRSSLHMHLPKEQKENQCQEKTTEMRMQWDGGWLLASEQQGTGHPRVRATDPSRYLQDAGHGAPPALLPPSSGRAWVRGSPGDRLEAGTAAGPLQPTFPQIQIRGPRCELRGHRPRPPRLGPAPGPVHWLAAPETPPTDYVPSGSPAAAPRCLLLFLFSLSLFFSPTPHSKRSVVQRMQSRLSSRQGSGSCWGEKAPFSSPRFGLLQQIREPLADISQFLKS